MNLQKLDSLLMQYLDGSLPPEQRAEVRRIIEGNTEARAELSAYQKLDDLFRAEVPMPDIQWDKLAKRISASIRQLTA
jgi:anti-sigma factor RsiW